MIKNKLYKKTRQLVRQDVFLSFLTNITGAATGLISFLLLSRLLTKEQFGQWILFLTASNFIDIIRFGLTRNAIINFVAGSKSDEKQKIISSSFTLGIGLVLIVTFFGSLVQFLGIAAHSPYLTVLKWYPLLAVANLSWNNAFSYLLGQSLFGKMLELRLFSSVPFLLLLIFNQFFWLFNLEMIILFFIISNLLPSIYAIVKKWDGLLQIKHTSIATMKKMFHYGIYSLGSTISGNLLKSADTFILAASTVLGSTAIALYAIPLKLTEIAELPLRSIASTAFPKLSAKFNAGDMNLFKKIFYTYSGSMFLLMIPFSLLGFIFSEPLVLFLGGKEYLNSVPLMANIFRIFTFYSLILPIDRMTGIALDSISKPKKNFQKVLIMFVTNVIGDLIAVFVFESLLMVSVATVVFTLIGTIVGYQFLYNELKIKPIYIFLHGKNFYLAMYKKLI